jgi:hypothetical protein
VVQLFVSILWRASGSFEGDLLFTGDFALIVSIVEHKYVEPAAIMEVPLS